MLQKIETLESNVNTIVLIPCPHCGQYSEEDMQTVLDAHKDNLPLVHLDCGKEFYVELHCLTRAAELLRAPVQTHTTEAIIKDIMDYVNVSLVDEHEVDFERFLRERVFGG